MATGYRGTAIHWHGPLCMTKFADLDTVIAGHEDVEFTAGLWNEKQILIQALEQWVRTLESLT